MNDYSPQQIAEMDRRIASVSETVDRWIWVYRMTTYKHKCGDSGESSSDTCSVGDPTLDVKRFYDWLYTGISADAEREDKDNTKEHVKDQVIQTLTEVISVLVRKVVNGVKVEEPATLELADWQREWLQAAYDGKEG